MHVVVWTPRGPSQNHQHEDGEREVALYAQVRGDILITGASDRIIVPTAGESKDIDEQIASDPDDFEPDEAWFLGCQGHPGVRFPAFKELNSP